MDFYEGIEKGCEVLLNPQSKPYVWGKEYQHIYIDENRLPEVYDLYVRELNEIGDARVELVVNGCSVISFWIYHKHLINKNDATYRKIQSFLKDKNIKSLEGVLYNKEKDCFYYKYGALNSGREINISGLNDSWVNWCLHRKIKELNWEIEQLRLEKESLQKNYKVINTNTEGHLAETLKILKDVVEVEKPKPKAVPQKQEIKAPQYYTGNRRVGG